MTDDDARNFYIPACRRIFDLGSYVTIAHAEELDRLLGLKIYEAYYSRSDPPALPDEVKQLLAMLAGPHGKTILKAYRIKKGLE